MKAPNEGQVSTGVSEASRFRANHVGRNNLEYRIP